MKAHTRWRLLIASQPLEAGVPRHVYDVIRLLAPEDFAVTVACPPKSELWHWLVDLPHVVRVPIASHREPNAWDAMSLCRLTALVHRADVVHAHSSKAGFLARLAVAARGRADRCIFTPHGWSFWSAAGGRARLFTALERTSARWCRTIVAVSDHERRVGLAQGVGRPDQYRVIRNGVDPARFAADPTPHPRRVLFIGRLAPPKRPDLVIRAIAQLRLTWSNVELHIAGDGPDRPRIEALVEVLGLRERVKLLGKRDDVPALLAQAACVAFASDSEACPLTILEAKAAGVPVAATEVGGVPEIVDDGVDGFVVPRDSVEAMAAAIGHLIANSEMARTMGAAGRVDVRAHYTSAAMASATATLYREACLARQPRAPRQAAVDPS